MMDRTMSLAYTPAGDLSRQVDADDLRHLEPQPARREDHGKVRRADARAEGAKGAVRRRMRVRDDDDLARRREAVVRHDLMADAFIDVHQVMDALLARKGAEALVVVRLLLGRARRVVVEEQDDVLRVDDALAAHLVERLDRLVVEIVDARPVHAAVDDLARMDGGFAGLCRQYLFNGMHDVQPSFSLMVYLLSAV